MFRPPGYKVLVQAIGFLCLGVVLFSGRSMAESPPIPSEATNPTPISESSQAPLTTESVLDHSRILPDLPLENLDIHTPPAKLSVYPPLPPNAVMGQFSKSIDHYSNNPEPPDWLAPYLSVRLRGKGTLRAYGFVRGDYAMATQRFQDLQFPQWVLPNDSRYVIGPNKIPITTDDGFNYNTFAKITRLGLEYFHQPSGLIEGGRVWGRIEADFLNNQTDTTLPFNQPSRPYLRLRLAYLGIGYGDWDFVMGQDWDIFSPLLPIVQAGTQMAYAGNTGDRRPCAYLNYDHDFGEGNRIQFQNGIALANAIDQADLNFDGQRGNEAYGLPGFESRLGFVLPTAVEKQPLMFGVSGVMADDYSGTGIGKSGARTFPQRALAGDIRFPINERITIQAECYAGYNLNEWRGGVGQGINPIEGKVIRAMGGWTEVVAQSCDYHRCSLGMGVDKANGSDVSEFGRTRNMIYWARNELLLDPSMILGCEYFYWSTMYKGLNSGNANLIQFFAQLNF